MDRFEAAARAAGWTFDEPANEYRLNDTGEGCDAIDANKTWEELCAFHGIKVPKYTYLLCDCGLETRVHCVAISCPRNT